jgi:glutathione S-transferase
MPHRLITIPASHYCDKARWALERAGIAFVEDGHAPLFHWRKTRPLGLKTVPVLVVQGGPVLGESTDILLWADKQLPADKRLFPVEPELLAAVQQWEETFDRKAGPYARRIVYHYLLQDRNLTVDTVAVQAPLWEKAAFHLAFPVIAKLMRKGMSVNAKRTAESVQKLDALMDEVAAALGDRQFLVGDRLTAADLTWATLTAPILAPDEYPTQLPRLDQMHPELAEKITAWRKHPAGQHALRLYREQRRARA